MTLIQTVLLYGCTAVCALYLVAGGYKTIRNYIQKKIDQAADAKNALNK
ncbi:DUF1378 family protein [Hafnia alvei]|uniref:DUF1378 family protein n=1 Tax=Hafnia alvei ATCC 51873 TaxID=1002364 RepID=G9Y0G4_HAFAL|nr:DUF1378 family protein [Hafnia alvei]EHM48843.1 hypothetical protein HMPREF0454_00022 [Hafnia alvei ATCC 51873]QQE44209.1 DUF1378 family protein [Hafnia alvei]